MSLGYPREENKKYGIAKCQDTSQMFANHYKIIIFLHVITWRFWIWSSKIPWSNYISTMGSSFANRNVHSINFRGQLLHDSNGFQDKESEKNPFQVCCSSEKTPQGITTSALFQSSASQCSTILRTWCKVTLLTCHPFYPHAKYCQNFQLFQNLKFSALIAFHHRHCHS